MRTWGYRSDELKLFYAVLNTAMCEATVHNLEIPIYVMTKRLFDAAGLGERDPKRLQAAILGTHEAETAAVHSPYSSVCFALGG